MPEYGGSARKCAEPHGAGPTTRSTEALARRGVGLARTAQFTNQDRRSGSTAEPWHAEAGVDHEGGPCRSTAGAHASARSRTEQSRRPGPRRLWRAGAWGWHERLSSRAKTRVQGPQQSPGAPKPEWTMKEARAGVRRERTQVRGAARSRADDPVHGGFGAPGRGAGTNGSVPETKPASTGIKRARGAGAGTTPRTARIRSTGTGASDSRLRFP